MRLLVTVTLNPNQLRAHLEPVLSLPEVTHVTLVADRHPPPIPKLVSVVPPRRMRMVLGRAGAKLWTCLRIAIRERPEWVLGYNLVPHGLSALLVARLTGAYSLLHLIGGPREFEGGGWMSDNAVLGRLGRPVHLLERLLLGALRRFTVVAVMGDQARGALIAGGVRPSRVVPIPASVDGERFRPRPGAPREWDLVIVSQLIPRKRLEDFLDAVSRLSKRHPRLRAAVVGTGPLDASLRERAAGAGIEDAVEFLGFRDDVEEIYARSGVFVLTSRSEGLSIAITEAMACGLPVVVTAVGEVGALVEEGRNGHLFAVGDVDALVEHVAGLLDDPAARDAMGAEAARSARLVAGPDRVRTLSRGALGRVSSQADAGR